MKTLLFTAALLLSFTTLTMAQSEAKSPSIHRFNVISLMGGEIDFADFEGKKILIVNTASECGYTPQYAELEKLYKTYGDDLVVVGFPANNFGGQEPGTNAQIKTFCEENYGVSFPMAAKVSVKGDKIAPIFEWLTSKAKNGVKDVKIKWNFTKFLLDEDGRLLASFESAVKPMSPEILSFLQ